MKIVTILLFCPLCACRANQFILSAAPRAITPLSTTVVDSLRFYKNTNLTSSPANMRIWW